MISDDGGICANMNELLGAKKMLLDTGNRKLIFGKCYIRLSNKEFTLMEYFMKNMGRVLTRTQILEEVWDRNIFCSTSTIDVHVSVLRRKIRKYLKSELIRTVYCVGYIFDY